MTDWKILFNHILKDHPLEIMARKSWFNCLFFFWHIKYYKFEIKTIILLKKFFYWILKQFKIWLEMSINLLYQGSVQFLKIQLSSFVWHNFSNIIIFIIIITHLVRSFCSWVESFQARNYFCQIVFSNHILHVSFEIFQSSNKLVISKIAIGTCFVIRHPMFIWSFNSRQYIKQKIVECNVAILSISKNPFSTTSLCANFCFIVWIPTRACII